MKYKYGKDMTGRPVFGFIFILAHFCIFAGAAMIVAAPDQSEPRLIMASPAFLTNSIRYAPPHYGARDLTEELQAKLLRQASLER